MQRARRLDHHGALERWERTGGIRLEEAVDLAAVYHRRHELAGGEPASGAARVWSADGCITSLRHFAAVAWHLAARRECTPCCSPSSSTTSAAVSATRSRLAKIDAIAERLRRAAPGEIAIVVELPLG